MNRPYITLGQLLARWFLVGLFLFGLGNIGMADDETGFISLFNGRDLQGWQLRRADRQGYVVEDGLLVCPADGGGFLFSQRQYADFTLRFEFRLSEGANNGLAIRCPLVDRRPAYEGMELQILDDIGYPGKLKPTQYHGSLYGVAPAERGALRAAGQWNAQEVTCDHRRIKVTLNERVVLDVNLDEITDPNVLKAHPGLQRTSGHIGFLGHGSRVEFRHIRLKPLTHRPQRLARELRRFPAGEAHQGVAVDVNHVYAITNRAIGKYEKQTGKVVATWQAPADSTLKHLNSGVVVDGQLYCAHSNWPSVPLKNSIEIFDAESLQPASNHFFTEHAGALTWVDRFRDHWWVGFAHYGDAESVARTTVHKLDDQWQVLGSWTFPRAVVERYLPYSNSGASFGPNGLLYATGHDRGEAYALRIPLDAEELELVDTVAADIAGQGIAWDRHDIGVLYGIHRASKHVIVARLSDANEFDQLLQPTTWRRAMPAPCLPPGSPGSSDATRCMNPWVLREGDEYRLYYSGGDANGKQRICVATAAVNDLANWQRHGPLFDVGAAGSFDASWCVLPHVVKVADDRWHLYYTGNAGRGAGLSAFPGIGLATSRDGTTWTRHGGNPVLKPTGQPGDPDAIGIAGGSVLSVTLPSGQTQWRFYYTGCPTIGKPLALNQQKTICLATSADGIQWQRQGAVMLRDPQRDYENIGVAGPVVQQQSDGTFRMWYSAIGTRWGFYSICYAESDDGRHWRRGARSGDNLQLTPHGDGWERQMVEYPTVIAEGSGLRMFYCGNGYGRTGIGTAMGANATKF